MLDSNRFSIRMEFNREQFPSSVMFNQVRHPSNFLHDNAQAPYRKFHGNCPWEVFDERDFHDQRNAINRQRHDVSCMEADYRIPDAFRPSSVFREEYNENRPRLIRPPARHINNFISPMREEFLVIDSNCRTTYPAVIRAIENGMYPRENFHDFTLHRSFDDEEMKRPDRRSIWNRDLLRQTNTDDTDFRQYRRASIPDRFHDNNDLAELEQHRFVIERPPLKIPFPSGLQGQRVSLMDQRFTNSPSPEPQRLLVERPTFMNGFGREQSGDSGPNDWNEIQHKEPEPSRRLRRSHSIPDIPNAVLTDQIGSLVNDIHTLDIGLQRLNLENWGTVDATEIPITNFSEIQEISCQNDKHEEISVSHTSYDENTAPDENLPSSNLLKHAIQETAFVPSEHTDALSGSFRKRLNTAPSGTVLRKTTIQTQVVTKRVITRRRSSFGAKDLLGRGDPLILKVPSETTTSDTAATKKTLKLIPADFERPAQEATYRKRLSSFLRRNPHTDHQDFPIFLVHKVFTEKSSGGGKERNTLH